MLNIKSIIIYTSKICCLNLCINKIYELIEDNTEKIEDKIQEIKSKLLNIETVVDCIYEPIKKEALEDLMREYGVIVLDQMTI